MLILQLGSDIGIRPTKKYIVYRSDKGFAGIVVLWNVLKIYISIKKPALIDPLNKARDVEGIGHYAHGYTELSVSNEKEIPYVMTLCNPIL